MPHNPAKPKSVTRSGDQNGSCGEPDNSRQFETAKTVLPVRINKNGQPDILSWPFWRLIDGKLRHISGTIALKTLVINTSFPDVGIDVGLVYHAHQVSVFRFN